MAEFNPAQGETVLYVNPAKGTTVTATVAINKETHVEGTSHKLPEGNVTVLVHGPNRVRTRTVPTKERYDEIVAEANAAKEAAGSDVPTFDEYGYRVWPTKPELPRRFVAPLGFVPEKPVQADAETGEVEDEDFED